MRYDVVGRHRNLAHDFGVPLGHDAGDDVMVAFTPSRAAMPHERCATWPYSAKPMALSPARLI
jgi:hypothetical protein